MNRRVLLATAAGLLGAGTGCSATETTTPTVTATATPEPASFEVKLDVPNSVPLNEGYRVDVDVTNTGGQTGMFEEPLVMRFDGERDLRPVSVIVDPGATSTEWIAIGAHNESGTARFELRGASATTEITADGLAPEILRVATVTEWDDYGDLADNSRTRFAVGAPMEVAVRHRSVVHDGTLDVYQQLRVYNAADERVYTDNYTGEQLFEYSGYQRFERAFAVDTTGWEAGEYTAEITLRDEVNGEVSEPETTTFELV